MNTNTFSSLYSQNLLQVLRILPRADDAADDAADDLADDLDDNGAYDADFTNILDASLYDKPKYKTVIDDAAEKKYLRESQYDPSKNAYSNSSCPIFQVDFANGDDIIILPCRHCFIPEAIKKWLTEEKSECPVCRYKFASKEILNNENIINIGDEESGINNTLANALGRGYSLPQSDYRWTNEPVNTRYNNISLISVILHEVIARENQALLNEALINRLRQ